MRTECLLSLSSRTCSCLVPETISFCLKVETVLENESGEQKQTDFILRKKWYVHVYWRLGTFRAQIMLVNTSKCYVEMCVDVEIRENRLKEPNWAYTETEFIFRMEKKWVHTPNKSEGGMIRCIKSHITSFQTMNILKTFPRVVTAHLFCASRSRATSKPKVEKIRHVLG